MAQATLDDVLAEVQQESTIEDSLLKLFTTAQAQAAAVGNDPVKVQAIFDGLVANVTKVTAAVTAGTPAAPAPAAPTA